ncbi:flagellar protein FlaG [mine drainage metagenome]|uniref:Flagellar protein FlaG n=1 Tax=mine drainage metagenome TaxID=410659 RepID=A0A1J5T3Q4_9ZZZZ
MLIQNVTSNSVPAPAASYGNTGSPAIAVNTPAAGSAPVVLPQTAVPPVGTQAANAQAANTQAASAQAAQPTNAQIQSAVDKVNQAMLQANTGVEFSIDQSSNRTLVKVVDTKTGETIKQFPSKEMIAISQSIDQFQKGLLLRQKA